jgi:hypothetical protein
MRRLSPARPLVSVVVLALAVGIRAPSSRAGEALRYDVRAELGGEYDDNAHRAEVVQGVENQPAVVGSPLARAAVGGRLSDVIARGQQLALSATLAGKIFTGSSARTEDVAIADSSARWRLNLGSASGVAAQVVYYEAFQRQGDDATTAPDRRDFRSLTPALYLDRRLTDSAVLVAGAAYRWFIFKSDQDFDFQAPSGSLDVRWSRDGADSADGADGDDSGGAPDWEIGGGASVEQRSFDGPGLPATGTITAAAPRRSDTFLLGHVEVTRVAGFLASAGYALQINRSNSYGETLTRHVATLRVAAALPLQCYLAARAELIFAHYRDPVAIGRVSTNGTLLSIDNENRSSLRVELSRVLSPRWLLLGRYTVYANEIGVSSAVAHYRRQTALLALAFTFER